MEAYSTGSRTVSVEAKPESITIDLAMTAALVVDMQNDFAAKGGMFERAGMIFRLRARRSRRQLGPWPPFGRRGSASSISKWVSVLIYPISALPALRTGSSIYRGRSERPSRHRTDEKAESSSGIREIRTSSTS